jgi:hypothetical protein
LPVGWNTQHQRPQPDGDEFGEKNIVTKSRCRMTRSGRVNGRRESWQERNDLREKLTFVVEPEDTTALRHFRRRSPTSLQDVIFDLSETLSHGNHSVQCPMEHCRSFHRDEKLSPSLSEYIYSALGIPHETRIAFLVKHCVLLGQADSLKTTRLSSLCIPNDIRIPTPRSHGTAAHNADGIHALLHACSSSCISARAVQVCDQSQNFAKAFVDTFPRASPIRTHLSLDEAVY